MNFFDEENVVPSSQPMEVAQDDDGNYFMYARYRSLRLTGDGPLDAGLCLRFNGVYMIYKLISYAHVLCSQRTWCI